MARRWLIASSALAHVAIAGGLYVHLTQSFDIVTYGPGASLDVFTAGVVGGLGSLFGGVLGAIFLRGSQWFITEPAWQFLSSAVGVLLVLLILPGGLASLVIKLRDRLVKAIVERRRRDDEEHVFDGVADLVVADLDITELAVAHAAVEENPTELGTAGNVIVERSQP